MARPISTSATGRTAASLRTDGGVCPARVHARHARGRRRGGTRPHRTGRTGLLSAARHRAAARPDARGRDHTATPHAVVISHGLWQQRFGADRRVIGRTMLLNDMNVEIVGVMPPEFELPDGRDPALAAAFLRTAVAGRTQPRCGRADRPRPAGPSATIESARAEMDAIAAQLRSNTPPPTPASA